MRFISLHFPIFWFIMTVNHLLLYLTKSLIIVFMLSFKYIHLQMVQWRYCPCFELSLLSLHFLGNLVLTPNTDFSCLSSKLCVIFFSTISHCKSNKDYFTLFFFFFRFNFSYLKYLRFSTFKYIHLYFGIWYLKFLISSSKSFFIFESDSVAVLPKNKFY